MDCLQTGLSAKCPIIVENSTKCGDQSRQTGLKYMLKSAI